MKLETHGIWNEYHTELFFFVLKRVKNTDIANEIIQNSFLKIHTHINSLKDASKIKSWVFQIVRNEIANFYSLNKAIDTTSYLKEPFLASQTKDDDLCCFDRFLGELPKKYKAVIEKVYFENKKSKEVAVELGISLANVKARVRRAKGMLRERLNACCKFYFDKNGKLKGTSDCKVCGSD